MTTLYNPRDWYWIVGGDQERVFSSKAGTYVSPEDTAYAEFLQSYGPTSIATEAELLEVLSQQAPDVVMETKLGLIAYANRLQWAMATGGYMATINGQQVPFSTTPESLGLISGKVARLQQPNPPATILWQVGPSDFVNIAAADFEAAAIAIADYVQATFDVLSAVMIKIKSGQTTTKAQVDADLIV
jgi:hypothetical protein